MILTEDPDFPSPRFRDSGVSGTRLRSWIHRLFDCFGKIGKSGSPAIPIYRFRAFVISGVCALDAWFVG